MNVAFIASGKHVCPRTSKEREMIEQVKVLFQERRFVCVAIIDDAFDDRPRPRHVDNIQWDLFFDDLDEEDEKRISEAYGVEAYGDRDPTVLRHDQAFIDMLWNARSTMESAAALFDEFERIQDRKRTELSPLCQLLERDLGVTCRTFGRDVAADVTGASIVFLDLFLGAFDDDEAISRAIDRVKGIVANRLQTPPSIVLLSASPRLEELGPRLRDEAELLGCLFRMVKKSALGDAEVMTEKLY